MQVYTAIKLGSPGPIMFKSSAFGFQWISLTCATITLINASCIFILYYPTQGLKPERQDSLVIPLDNHRTTSWQPMYAQWSPKYAKAVPRCTSSQDWLVRKLIWMECQQRLSWAKECRKYAKGMPTPNIKDVV